MGIDKYRCFMQYMFIISETIQSVKTRQTVIDVFQRTCLFLLDTWEKEQINTRFILLLFICSEQFTDTSLFTFLHDRSALLLNMQNI